MVAKDGITQIDAVSQTFTDFFFLEKGSGEACQFFLFYVSEKLTMTKSKMTMTKLLRH